MQSILNFEQINSLITTYQELKNIVNNLNACIAHVHNDKVRSLIVQLNLKFNDLELKIQDLKTILLTALSASMFNVKQR